MRRRRIIALATLASAGALIVAALGASSAQGAVTFNFEFGASGTGAGQFSTPSDIAINQSTGDVYVTDRTLNRVSKFNAAGVFQLMWGKDVVSSGPDDTGTGFEVCNVAANPTDVCKTGVAGPTSGAMDQPQGVGVDSSTGDVYVQDTGNIRVQKFNANGGFILMWGKGVNETTSGNICTAESGNACKVGSASGNAGTNEPSELGVFSIWHLCCQIEENNPALTVDSSGYVYVGEANAVGTGVFPDEYPDARVQKFDSSGHFVSVLSPPDRGGNELRYPRSLAVAANGDFYVRDDVYDSAAQGVIRFAPSAFHPELFNSFAAAFWGENVTFSEAPLEVDPSNQFVLSAEETNCSIAPGGGLHIVEWDPFGHELDCTSVPSANVNALAMNPSHRLYALIDGSPDRVVVYNTPSATPPNVIGTPQAKEITTNKAVIKTQIAGNLGETTFHVEYGIDPCSPGPCESTAESSSIGASYQPKAVSGAVNGLKPDTEYHYRVVATNEAGPAISSEGVFRTYPTAGFDPKCPNNLARQQTHAALLLDCRAYELVSPEEQGGYDVESDVVPGQEPFGGYPLAHDKALFGIHDGGIPGVGKPTNRGIDPYVATRDAKNGRWNTEYVGVPADAPSAEPFSSTLSGADSTLDTFSFGGPDICNPCFSDGKSGIPVHMPNGSLVQGMMPGPGAIPVADPQPSGEVKKPLSTDGSHLVFGSKQSFAKGANHNGTDVTIYDRDLLTGAVQIASTDPSGTALADGSNVAELDISNGGSRILIGDLVSTDSAGNKYWHLYMHSGNSPNSIDLTPGATDGVLYDGMTADGSIVYFTTVDPLTTSENQDIDNSADIFRSDVGSSSATLTRVSIGTSAGNTDLCDPTRNSYNFENWNVIPGGPTDCSVVAIGGGGGVASGNGSIYFLSPEELDGNGTAGSVNLFLARPGGSPQFVRTLESGGPPPSHNLKKTLTPFTHPEGAAFDHLDGSFYAYDVGTAGELGGPGANVQKFDSAGKPVTGFGTSGKLSGGGAPCGTLQSIADTSLFDGFLVGELGAAALSESVPTQIAVDNDPGSSSYRDLYVVSTNEFNGFFVKKFGPTGTCLASIPVETSAFSLQFPGAVAVDQITGKLYVGVVDPFGSNRVKIYKPDGTPATTPKAEIAVTGQPRGIAVDGTGEGKVYVANGTSTRVYNATTGAFASTLDSNPSYGVSIDQTDGHVYVDEGTKVVEYTSGGAPVGGPIASGVVTKSKNLAADSGNIVISNWNGTASGSSFLLYGSPAIVPDRGYDSPLAIHGVSEAGTRHTADFQTTPDGDHAVFPSVLSFTGFDSGGKYELFHYDALGPELECVSCAVTLDTPTTDAALASNGLSLSDDGRIFFSTGEPLVVRDTNGKRDVYEWSDGKVELISSGQDRSDSSLLTTSADAVDALFFTRETLADNDRNGTLMKLYDARSEGGFFVIPPPPGCRASDECHGAGSEPPAPLTIGTIKGDKGNVEGCKRGYVMKHGKCVKKRPKKHRKHHRHSTRRHG